MIPDRVLNHVDQGLLRLLSQFKGRPRIAAWSSAYLNQCQKLEDAIFDVLIRRLIDQAEGVQLDAIGRIVGELRDNLDDTNYRIFIFARIRINRSRGNIDDVLAVLALITATPVLFHEFRPACLYLEAFVIMDRDPVVIYSHLREAKAGGVKLTLVVPTTNTRQLQPISVLVTESHTDGSVSLSPTTLTSAAGAFPPGVVGGKVTITNGLTGATNGTFPITARPSSTTIRFTNPSAVVDGHNGSLHYTIVNGVDGGANNPDHAAGDGGPGVGPAILTSIYTEPFALTDGDTLDVFYPGGNHTFVLNAGDFVDITHATASEVAAVLNAQVRRRGFVASAVGGAVVLTTYARGASAEAGANATAGNTVIGLPNTAFGTGDASYGLASDAVSLRDPNAVPTPVVGAPVISFIDPDFGAAP